MKWILIALGILVLIVGIIVLIGVLLPKKHKASLNQTFNVSPEEVWGLIYDFENYADWRKNLKEVSIISEGTWAEIDHRNDKITFKIIEAQPSKKMVTKIVDENLPFGGSWIFELQRVDGGTRLSITENGEIKNVIYRFFAHFIFGYEATIKQYLSDLDYALGKQST